MSSTIAQRIPAVDYFSLSSLKSQNSSTANTPSFTWDSTVFDDSALDLGASDSCNSTLPSPTSPSSLAFPSTTNTYGLPPAKGSFSPDLPAEKAFNFGSFEDWMRWDDPSDAALSPTTDFFPELKLEPNSPAMANLDLQNDRVSRLAAMNNDECAVFGDDNMNEAPLFQSPSTFAPEVPQREGLYSTPLSWSRPTLGPRSQSFSASILSPQEENRLRNIAMPNRPQQSHSAQYPASPESTSSPEPFMEKRKKRKSSVEEEDDDDYEQNSSNSSGKHPVVKKTAHNMIEKRYRTNLNDKIAALRDSVPSLRVMSKKNSRNEDIEEDLQGLTPAHKLNKATVLSKATEYIAHLEKRNKYLNRENASLRSRVDAFEILVTARQGQGQSPAPSMSQRQHRNSTNSRQMPNGYMM